jgi:hypothetical protein
MIHTTTDSVVDGWPPPLDGNTTNKAPELPGYVMLPGEPQRIYTAIFNRPIPPIVEAHFLAACERLQRDVPPAELDACHRAVSAAADLEALEVAARYARKLPLLTRKFRLMAFLAETLPENQPFFIQQKNGLAGALWLGATGSLRTAFKLAKGLWLLRQARVSPVSAPHA